MISFKEFFILQENSLKDIPRKLLGMHNTLEKLPDNSPYGFWVDRSGNFVVTNSHLGTAQQIIGFANDYLGAKGQPQISYPKLSYKRPYEILYDDGWMRVVSAYNTIYYKLKAGNEATVPQMKFLNFIKDFYDKTEIIKDRPD